MLRVRRGDVKSRVNHNSSAGRAVADEARIVFASTLAAVTGAGVPGSSLVTTLVVLNAIGLGPHAVSGIALVLGVDRLLDMLRTTVNLTSSLTCAAYVGRCERRAPTNANADLATGT